MRITDVLILGPAELQILCDEYVGCRVERLSPSYSLIQQYRITIEVEDEGSYYDFLLDNSMATASHNFYYRVRLDKAFSEKIRRRKLK
ncbi:hypothetical protein KP004_17240 [Geomonas oryzisoli]|uniref:KTSC domain-containing protein n=1 Tax=Geomonas oryzisoli TaxID=2847992 RepID=A0ABX8JBH7_9BACT|nr:hypothetical protein [Geomonas oryzisoli]QWV92895.1 hypothetical protein KP004_17240 [Geomonas oryzisoli]